MTQQSVAAADATMWDAIVVGAGIEGSAAAYTLAKRGRRTLLLEQFIVPHSRGSSHGHSRITRMSYAQQFHVRMMADAFRLWNELENEAATRLYVKTGLLMVDKSGSAELKDVEKSLKAEGSPHECLSGATISRRFADMPFDASFDGIFDPTGGILCADKCLRAYQTQFVKNGGLIRDGEAVLGAVSESNDVIRLRTSKTEYRARAVVLAAGAWMGPLTKTLTGLQLPLSVKRVVVWYWKQLEANAFGGQGSPVFIYADGQHSIYGFPAFEYPGFVKVAYHSGPDVDADRRDANVVDAFYRDSTADFVRRHLAGVEATPSITETCMYTMTPDGYFILDTHPTWKNVVIAAGFSGHGFKLAPVVGKILADLATGQRSSYDLSPFKLDRFTSDKGVPSAKL